MRPGPARKVRVGGKEITYRIARSTTRAQTITVQVKPDGSVLALAPTRVSTGRLDALVTAKAAWIFSKQKLRTVTQRREFVSGDSIPVFGQNLRLRVVTGAGSARVERQGRWLHVTTPKLSPTRRRLTIRRALVRWYRATAEEKLQTRMEHLARQLGTTPPRLLIRDQLRRWASCAPDGTLRFNWRLAMAPLSLVDYVVAHELCHLRHPNHSSAFWATLRSLLPEYVTRRAELRRQGQEFTL